MCDDRKCSSWLHFLPCGNSALRTSFRRCLFLLSINWISSQGWHLAFFYFKICKFLSFRFDVFLLCILVDPVYPRNAEIRGCFEIGYHFHKNLKYWNSWYCFLKKQKAVIQDQKKYIRKLFASCLCPEKRHFRNIGGSINLPDGHTQMPAHSLPDST